MQAGVVRETLEGKNIRVPLLRSLLQALYYIHVQNLVHGDVKPANLLVLFDGTLQMTDFDLVHVINWIVSLSAASQESSIGGACQRNGGGDEQTFQKTELDAIRRAAGTLPYMVRVFLRVAVWWWWSHVSYHRRGSCREVTRRPQVRISSRLECVV